MVERDMLSKYQIVETVENCNHAGSKAINDIKDIAEKLGFKPVNIWKAEFYSKNY